MSPPFDLRKAAVALFNRGSHAYGLATEASDHDLGGVVIPPKPYHLGAAFKFEQTETIGPVLGLFGGVAASGKKAEGTLWALGKFVRLAADCNPNMVELLFLDPADYYLVAPQFEKLIAVRDWFLSKKARFTFTGYAHSQIKRINTHRKWLLDPPKAKPRRSDFGLPEAKPPQYEPAEALIRSQVDSWAFHDLDLDPEVAHAVRMKTSERLAWSLLALREKAGLPLELDDLDSTAAVRTAAMTKLGFDENLMLVIQKEHDFRTKLEHFNQYETWKRTRNPDRAALEAKFGYDCKHAMHVVRLLRMGEEILRDGKVIVKRPDREELLAVRNGAWSYERLMEEAEGADSRIAGLYADSPLPRAPDIGRIDDAVVEIVESFLYG